MEWVWRPMWKTIGKTAQIFTHTLYHHYSAPPGFDFEYDDAHDTFDSLRGTRGYNAPRKTF